MLWESKIELGEKFYNPKSSTTRLAYSTMNDPQARWQAAPTRVPSIDRLAWRLQVLYRSLMAVKDSRSASASSLGGVCTASLERTRDKSERTTTPLQGLPGRTSERS